MKKTYVIFILLAFFSCKGSVNVQEGSTSKPKFAEKLNPYKIPDSLLITGSYLVFLDEKIFVPFLMEWDEKYEEDSIAMLKIENAKRDSILSYAKRNKLRVDPNRLFIYSKSGFYIDNVSEIKMLEFLEDNKSLQRVQQNFMMQNTRARMQSGNPIPQNTRARMQSEPDWGYDAENFTSKSIIYLAGNERVNNSDSKIWIVDSGIDANHPDLKNQVSANLSRSFVFNNGNVFDLDPFFDYWGHGTHCAGLAAASSSTQNNPNEPERIGMNGASPGATLVSLKVFGLRPYAEFDWIVEAIEYAARRTNLKKGDIISMSLGAKIGFVSCDDYELYDQLRLVAEKKKVSIVISAGNGYDWYGEPADSFLPACINGEGIFTIGSIDLDYLNGAIKFSEFSNYGTPPIDWVLPGNYIFSTYPGGKYAVMQGTSMSTAIMAGLLHLTNGNLQLKTSVPGRNGETYSYPVPMK